MVADDIGAQTQQVLDNISGLLKSEGLSLGDVLKTTDLSYRSRQFPDRERNLRLLFHNQPPAGSTVQVSALPKGAKIEIEVITPAQMAGDQQRYVGLKLLTSDLSVRHSEQQVTENWQGASPTGLKKRQAKRLPTEVRYRTTIQWQLDSLVFARRKMIFVDHARAGVPAQHGVIISSRAKRFRLFEPRHRLTESLVSLVTTAGRPACQLRFSPALRQIPL